MSDENHAESYVVKINTALSNKPFFVKIHDPNMSLDSIFKEAIATLKQTKPLESQQLEQLYQAHQIFNEGKLVQKGDLFTELGKKDQAVGNMVAHIAELDLIASHSGGIHDKKESPKKSPEIPNFDDENPSIPIPGISQDKETQEGLKKLQASIKSFATSECPAMAAE